MQGKRKKCCVLIIVDYLFDGYYHQIMMILMIYLNDLMVLTMAVNFVKHLKMHLNILMNYYYQLIFDEMVMLILDLMITNDDGESLLIQDDLLLVVLVHVLQLFDVATLFGDFGTMSKMSVNDKFNKNQLKTIFCIL